MPSIFACPHCGLPLEHTATGATCGGNHNFDRAREGYLNLLVGGRLPAVTTPGDTAESLAARRRFLSTGAYAPVSDAVNSALGDTEGHVLDVGCGEGWYLSRIDRPDRTGIDISKRAVQMAARAMPGDSFAVANAHRMPVIDASCGVVMSVFAPHPFAEFTRVLQPGGLWVTATPGPLHLREMRPEYEPGAAAIDRFDRRAEPPTEAEHSERVTFTLQLTDTSAGDLWEMTPLQFQAGSVRSNVGSVTVDVWVSSARVATVGS